MNNFYDIIIIGGGPAGLTASIYCARANKKVLVIEKSACGGKITETPKVENIPGFTSISGSDFASNLYEQSLSCGVNIDEGTEVLDVIKNADSTLSIITDINDIIYTCAVCIVATGTKNRTLNLPYENELIGHNISFCVTCDGPFYENKDVVVVGGGNSAVTEAIELSEIANKVYIIQNLSELTAEKVLIDKLPSNISIITNAVVSEYCLQNNSFVGVKINGLNFIKCDGVFLAIGLVPQNNFLKNINVIMDNYGYIKINSLNQTSVDNIFACGDCIGNSFKQVAIACGSGAITSLNVLNYLR